MEPASKSTAHALLNPLRRPESTRSEDITPDRRDRFAGSVDVHVSLPLQATGSRHLSTGTDVGQLYRELQLSRWSTLGLLFRRAHLDSPKSTGTLMCPVSTGTTKYVALQNGIKPVAMSSLD